MKVELRQIRYAAFASDETSCYSANVYIDGKPAGTVSNQGHGGPDMFSDPATERRLDEYAKTLPKLVADFNDPKTGKPFEMEQTAETLCHELLYKHLAERELVRKLKTKVVFTKPNNDSLWLSKKHAPEVIAKAVSAAEIENTKRKLGADVILNAIPLDEAVALYRARMG